MADFPRIPAPGERFKLKARDTQKVIFSRLKPDPTVYHWPDENYPDQIFTLIHGRGDRQGQYAIKSWANGRVLFSRTHAKPHVGNIPGDGDYPDNWFRFVQDQYDKDSFRIYCPASNTVLFSRFSPEATFGNHTGAQHNDQLWRFKLVGHLQEE